MAHILTALLRWSLTGKQFSFGERHASTSIPACLQKLVRMATILRLIIVPVPLPLLSLLPPLPANIRDVGLSEGSELGPTDLLVRHVARFSLCSHPTLPSSFVRCLSFARSLDFMALGVLSIKMRTNAASTCY